MDSSPSPALQLSPSLNHRHVLQAIKPKLAYDSGDVAAWQAELRAQLRQLTGYDAMPLEEDWPLNVRSLWRRQHRLGSIEKVAFVAEPGADVTAYLCLPREAQPPYATMICLQGHTTGMHVSIGVQRDDETRTTQAEGDRDFGLQCLERGLAALCIEQRSFGERRELHQQMISDHGCHDAAMHALVLGRTLAGERVFDVEKGLDFLQTRDEIDMKRVGVMGNSGGGTVSIYAAALLPRLGFAMPSCSFCSFADSIMAIYHCADNYIPGLLQFAEAADVLGLFAPKPLVVVAGQEDDIFPIAGVRREFDRLREIYGALGAADNCRLVVGEGGHRFYADAAWPQMLELIHQI